SSLRTRSIAVCLRTKMEGSLYEQSAPERHDKRMRDHAGPDTAGLLVCHSAEPSKHGVNRRHLPVGKGTEGKMRCTVEERCSDHGDLRSTCPVFEPLLQ